MNSASTRPLRFFSLCVLGVLCALLLNPHVAAAKRSLQAEARKVAAEQKRVATDRAAMEQRHAALQRDLERLDRQLAPVHTAFRKADDAVRASDRQLNKLAAEERLLQQRTEAVRRRMLGQAEAAWRRGGEHSLRVEMLRPGHIGELPHRHMLLQQLLETQQAEREQFALDMRRLEELQAEVSAQRTQLATLRDGRQKQERQLNRQLAERRKLAASLLRDVRLKRQREADLARQQQRLQAKLHELAATPAAPPVRAASTGIGRVAGGEAPSTSQLGRGKLPWPLHGRVVARFGSVPAPGQAPLSGVQLAPAAGERQVRSIAAGQVRYADWFGGYGQMVIIDHGKGLMSIYAHNAQLLRKAGSWVEAGEAIAEAGNTGLVEEVRLYFEVRRNGRPVDPAQWCGR